MQFIKNLFSGREKRVADDRQAHALNSEIIRLEEKLSLNQNDIEVQQQLLVKYTQAVSVYSQTATYQHCVNDIFDKINALRNSARKNF